MWNFYKAVIRSSVREFWTATDDVLTGIAILFFILILCNRKYGEHIMTAWNGISPWWSTIPISMIVLYRLSRANYEQFSKVKLERDDAVGKLESPTRLPANRPIVAPYGYGRSGEGLIVVNSGYAAFDVHIPPVTLGSSLYTLKFPLRVAQLTERDQKCFFTAWLEHPTKPGLDGGQLKDVMRTANLESLPLGILYKDSEIRWYRSNCLIDRDVNVPGGIRIGYLGQELIPNPSRASAG